MELHPSSRVAGADDAADACIRYLDRLPLAPEQRAALLRRVAGDVGPAADSRSRDDAALHEALAGGDVDPDNPALASIRRRLELAYAATDAVHPPPLAHDALGRERLITAPPLDAHVDGAARLAARAARAVVPALCAPRRAGATTRRTAADAAAIRFSDAPERRARWHRAATFRRIVLTGLIVVADLHRDQFHGRRAAVPRAPAAGDRDPGAVRDPVRLGLGRLLDRDGRLRPAGVRPRSLCDLATARAATRRSTPRRAPRSSCRSATRTCRASSRACARPTNRWRAPASCSTSISSCCPTAASRTCASPSSTRGWRCAARWTASAACSTAGGSTGSSARAATSPISAGAGAATTATWSCSMPTAS